MPFMSPLPIGSGISAGKAFSETPDPGNAFGGTRDSWLIGREEDLLDRSRQQRLQPRLPLRAPEKRTGQVSIKITDLKCAIIGRNPVVRIVTDQGVSGYGQAESYKPYLKPMVLFYRDYLLGKTRRTWNA